MQLPAQRNRKGKNYLQEANQEMIKIIAQYKQLVGEADLNTMVEVLSKIIRFHKTLHGGNMEEEA